jgi:predicted dehydrogenase
MPSRLTRRRFLQSNAIAGGVLICGASLRADQKQPPSEKLNVAVVGIAGQGAYDLGQVAAAGGANIVALCDVDENRTGPARKEFPRAVFEIDYRKVVDRKDVDAVVIATPDHTHAPIAIAALRAGKHVYCEKPLAHTIHEVRAISELAAKQKRVTQMGTQIHAGSNYRRVVELIQSGAIGIVKEVHTWCGRSYWGGDHPTEKQDVPAGLHYDLWLGPAPFRPYHKDHLHFWWRKWWDFGGGTLNDMACHHMDLPFWALKLRTPTTVAAEGAPLHRDSVAKWLLVHYEFEARGWLPAVKLTWYDGGKRPALMSQQDMPKWGDGNLFVGTKGMLLADYNNFKLLPEKDFKGFQMPKRTIPDSIGHHKEWVEACKHGGRTTCNFDYSGALSEAVLLGTVSYRSGKSFSWDPVKFKTSECAANEFLHKEYRKGWTI